LDNVKEPDATAEDGNGFFILLTSSKYTETWKDGKRETDKGWADLVAIDEFKQRVRTVASGPGWLRSFDTWWDKRCKVKRITDDASMMNHCKVLVADKKLMYIGSDNYYPSYNEEHGIWLEDSDTIKAWHKGYWTPRWKSAKDASTDKETKDFAATMT
jgi:phosphatidylserine/phosphatidylglycerophosphate/cardiolipin synthase-like enzyme